MADFLPAFQNTLHYEDSIPSGRVTVEPDDPRFPGVTQHARFGINSAAHPNMPEEFWEGPVDQAFPMAQAVYKTAYWDPLQLDNILNQELANKIFDMAVNMGRGEAAILAQKAAVVLGSTIATDGTMGPQTLAALDSFPPGDLLNELRILSVAYYAHLEQVHPADARWNNSWMARARA